MIADGSVAFLKKRSFLKVRVESDGSSLFRRNERRESSTWSVAEHSSSLCNAVGIRGAQLFSGQKSSAESSFVFRVRRRTIAYAKKKRPAVFTAERFFKRQSFMPLPLGNLSSPGNRRLLFSRIADVRLCCTNFRASDLSPV